MLRYPAGLAQLVNQNLAIENLNFQKVIGEKKKKSTSGTFSFFAPNILSAFLLSISISINGVEEMHI